jgi:hypothetical protein
MRDLPELVCPDTYHSPKGEHNRDHVRRDELNLYVSGFLFRGIKARLTIFFESIFQ